VSNLVWFCVACENEGQNVTFDNDADAFSHATDAHLAMREVDDDGDEK
jgi:hypothetical protein